MNITPERTKEVLAAIELLANNSNTYISWALLIIGSSILTIVSTSYLSPLNKKIRRIYLLFLPGWMSLVYSIYNGDLINRNYISMVLLHRKTENFDDKFISMSISINNYLTLQLNSFMLGIVFFSLWLAAFLMWWVYGKWYLIYNKNQEL
jgi:hypothetical protein